MRAIIRKMEMGLLSLLVVCFLISCQTSFDIEGRLLDMTYAYDETSIYWPNAEPFVLESLNFHMNVSILSTKLK